MELHYLTASHPGTGGRIKAAPEDFVVEEVPVYEPCGEGDHLFVRIEKRGMSTFDAIRKIARELRVPEESVGYAGLKDKAAITRQTISLERVEEERVRALAIDGLRVLDTARHRHRLRIGHLAGNAFDVVVRDVPPARIADAERVLAELLEKGVPNYYDRQRFGLLRNSHLLGRAVVLGDADLFQRHILGESAVRDERFERALALHREGDHVGASRALPGLFSVEKRYLAMLGRRGDPERAMRMIPRKKLQFFVSAYQSYLFNQVLSRRIDSIHRLLPGDLAAFATGGKVFLAEDPEAEAGRLGSFEVSPTGPIFGFRMPAPSGEPARMEAEVLAAEGITTDSFRLRGGLACRGVRRPLRFQILDARFERTEDGFRLGFRLRKGCYATMVLREILKPGDELPLVEGD
jgi:tRNA pseudouridine13 synthase